MSTIEALEQRITSALERIGTGLDQLSAPVAQAVPEPGLQEALDEEKLANTQLQERLKAVNQQFEASTAEAKERLAAQAETLERLDMEVQQLQRANQQLRDNNAALRAANAEGVAQPELINQGLEAELDGLRAARSADRAELDAVLAELKPIVEGQV
ncbi:hypothetical protein [Algirhabdus cladophorae]|uniref:hypothetical protein n=1 Tax=Algirhabdus cladophorae TaxID=3377108 RepID=UPI003B845560